MWSGVLASTYITVISLQQIPQLWSVFLNRSMNIARKSQWKSVSPYFRMNINDLDAMTMSSVV